MSKSTVAVDSKTKRMLDLVKTETNSETFNETIKKLILERKKPKRSMFGTLRGFKKEFKRRELDRFS